MPASLPFNSFAVLGLSWDLVKVWTLRGPHRAQQLQPMDLAVHDGWDSVSRPGMEHSPAVPKTGFSVCFSEFSNLFSFMCDSVVFI